MIITVLHFDFTLSSCNATKQKTFIIGAVPKNIAYGGMK